MYNDITLCLAVKVDSHSRSILAICEIGMFKKKKKNNGISLWIEILMILTIGHTHSEKDIILLNSLLKFNEFNEKIFPSCIV